MPVCRPWECVAIALHCLAHCSFIRTTMISLTGLPHLLARQTLFHDFALRVAVPWTRAGSVDNRADWYKPLLSRRDCWGVCSCIRLFRGLGVQRSTALGCVLVMNHVRLFAFRRWPRVCISLAISGTLATLDEDTHQG